MATITTDDDDLWFRRALDVFEGARYPLHPVGSKLLHFMLDGPEGCDATISASRFEIRYGRNASRHRASVTRPAGPGIPRWMSPSRKPSRPQPLGSST